MPGNSGEHMTGAETEVCGDRRVARVEDGKQAGEVVGMGAEQVTDEIDEPGPVKEVDPTRAPILFRFPTDQGTQFRRIL